MNTDNSTFQTELPKMCMSEKKIEERYQFELQKYNERNTAIARQFYVGIENTDEQKERWKIIFDNKLSFKREITGVKYDFVAEV